MRDKFSEKMLFVFWALIASGLSSMSYALTIEDAWQATKQYDPEYLRSQLDEKISETTIRSSKSALLPSARITATTAWNENSTYGIALEQIIWDSSKWSELDSSQASLLASQLKIKQSHNELAGRLISAYLDLAQSQGELRLAQQKFDEGRKMLRIVELRYKAGKIRSVDLEDMRSNHLDEEANILANRLQVEDKKVRLIKLISIEPTQVNEIKTNNLSQPKLIVNSKQEWLKLASNYSPDLLMAKQNIRISELETGKAKTGYYPTITASVGYSDNTRSDNTRSDSGLNASLNLSLPLDLNSSIGSSVERAKLEVLRAKQDVRAVEIEIKSTISNRFNQLSLNWQRVEMAEKQVASKELVLKSKQAIYKAGMAEASDIIEAHNSLFVSKSSLQSLLYQYWRDRISLLKSVGRLDDETITLISQALQS
ncbi:outer membrane protein TolC [Aliivibrio fischeri ES114]|uniref:Outer membrane protein TolC n=1 Tax=Aliivibrio fischeri (strain ATCC 700601 / ES114) TaxID=312309 RepID=Q5E5N9_ALIF1|nr:TolC family protein [Aliivibrio fischeri]AAW85657.1 outer membrane protein TolC [Aliivibrio fischeri ES114]KLU80072.1 membrane protein [Aliivibrio fischeri]